MTVSGLFYFGRNLMYSLKDDIEAMFLNSPDKIRAKKKLNELFDKYGESKRAIENGAEGAEYMEYVMASAFADDVLAERRKARGAAGEHSIMQRTPSNERQQDMEKSSYSDFEEEEEEEELSMTEQVKKVTEDKELAAKKKAKEDAFSLYKKERENYIPKDIAAKKEQVNLLMDKYGEDLNTANMTMADYSTYLSVSNYIDQVKQERMSDDNAKKYKNLEYGMIDNFTPLKTKLKDDEEFKKVLVDAENVIDYPYFDNKGLETSGIGYLMDERSIFLRQPWLYVNDDGTLTDATKEQKVAAYEDLTKLRAQLVKQYEEERRKNPDKEDKGPFNYKHTFYQDKTRLRLPPEFIEKEYKRQVDEALNRVKTSFVRYNKSHPDNKIIYTKLPKDVLIALTELSYNVGHLDKEYPDMLRALARGDYDQAALESHRIEKSKNDIKRNKYVFDILKKYAKK